MTLDDTLVPMPHLNEEQIEKIKSFKIPVDSAFPMTYWIASIEYESVMPTDAELRMIQSFIEFDVRRTYNETYQAKILAKPFPAEGGHVNKIFRKGAKWLKQAPLYEKGGEITSENSEGARLINGGDPCEGWRYRRGTWEDGYWPQWTNPRFTLIALMDRITGDGQIWKPWTLWKLEHPDIFGAVDG